MDRRGVQTRTCYGVPPESRKGEGDERRGSIKAWLGFRFAQVWVCGQAAGCASARDFTTEDPRGWNPNAEASGITLN